MSFSVIQAAKQAGAIPAVVSETKVFSWAELAEWVQAEAGVLTAHLETGWVRLTGRATVPFLVRLLALWELGVTVVLLHPRWGEEERQHAVAAVPEAVDVEGLEPAKAQPRLQQPVAPGVGERPMAVLFTSGSEGTPKAVALSRRAFAAAATASARRLGWREGDRWLLALPPAHVGGVSILTRCLAARKTVVLAPSQDPEELWWVMEHHRVTLVSLVPAQLARLLAARPGSPPPSLRAVLVGGGPCPAGLLAEGRGRGWPLLPTYGLTEACSQVATVAPDEEPVGSGRPLEGVDVRVRDGIIQLRGPTLLDGYVHEGTVRPAVDEEGWFSTSDVGELDGQGRLHVLGRRDDIIITGGEKVAPAEVEEVLRACPGVAAALVVGVPDDTWGEVVGALVVAGSLQQSEGDALRRTLAARLAPFKRPRRVRWVAELPLTEAGKEDRAAALALLLAHDEGKTR